MYIYIYIHMYAYVYIYMYTYRIHYIVTPMSLVITLLQLVTK